MSYEYAYIPHKYVDKDVQIWAEKALAFARKELRLPMINIKWFVHAADAIEIPESEYFVDERRIAGLHSIKTPCEISILAKQSEYQIQRTVCHEAFHAMQALKIPCVINVEPGAYDYGDNAILRLMELECSGELDELYIDHLAGKDWSETRRTEVAQKKDTKAKQIKKTYIY